MKKLIPGLTMFGTGLLGAVMMIVALVLSPQSPWYINGAQGIYSGIEFMEMEVLWRCAVCLPSVA